MAYLSPLPYSLGLILSVIFVLFSNCHSQSIAVDNAFDALEKLGCGEFKSIIRGAELENMYKSYKSLTLFVFNDTTYNLYRQNIDFDVTGDTDGSLRRKADYVETFTLPIALDTYSDSFNGNRPVNTNSRRQVKIFLNQKRLRYGNVASGTQGPTRYFCNGALITRPDIVAGQHVIHIIDKVLPMPYDTSVLAYVSGYLEGRQQYRFYREFMKHLDSQSFDDKELNYVSQIQQPLTNDQVTFFIPSDEAVANIPEGRRNELRSNTTKLLMILSLHIIPRKVVYTSVVNHNDGFVTQGESGPVVFRKNFNKEAVYVTGSLKGGDTVTARLFPADVTVNNGVVHQVDRILGFVYKTAFEEIQLDSVTNNLDGFIRVASSEIQNALSSPSEVTIFAPVNSAIQALRYVYPQYSKNQTLINRVLRLSMLEPGERVQLTNLPGGYNSRLEKETRYNGRRVKIYSQGNDIWVEGGYVRAKVIKPDIGVTNGYVHLIDAVFGVPTRDIVYTVYCDDRLARTYDQMVFVGLDKFMKDESLERNQECTHRSGVVSGSAGIPNQIPTNEYKELCGFGSNRCQFTFFVPNGTAIEAFSRSAAGREVMNEPRRWRWILRRLISTREVIYIDRLESGAPKRFVADNGEEVVVQVNSLSNLPSAKRTASIHYRGHSAEIIHSDIGATNGVVHIISSIIFTQEDLTASLKVTAFEELQLDNVTSNLDGFIRVASSEIQNALSSPSEVTIFAPVNSAIQALRYVYPQYAKNQTLINRVLRLSMLEPGERVQLTNLPGGYDSRLEKETRYNGRRVKIYSQGNYTWVEGGYVRAKVIKPDIGVTNGYVHHIDAVFGVPTRDIVYTVYCDDRLAHTYDQMVFVGLDKYMKDDLLEQNQECTHRSGVVSGSAGIPNQIPTNEYKELCGFGSNRCQFTFFVPNGIAIEAFIRGNAGRAVMNEPRRLRWILRRLISTREVIYIDRLQSGAPKRFVADNGEEVEVRVNSLSNLPSAKRTASIHYRGLSAEIIHSDIGATNGVVHIISSIIFNQEDLTRDISGSCKNQVSFAAFFSIIIMSFLSLKSL